MIIELKDIPQQPIKKIDVHIEFDTSKTTATPVNVSFEPNSFEQDKASPTSESHEIPKEMLNADF